MSQLILDFLFTFIFVLLLAILVKMRERIFSENNESFRYARSGLASLAFVSFLQAAYNQNLFETVPFLSEPVYLELILVIGLVTGVTLMLAGISIWIPSRRLQKNDNPPEEGRIRHLRQIIDEIDEVFDISQYLQILPAHLCSRAGYKKAAIVRLRDTGGQVRLVSSEGVDVLEKAEIERNVLVNDTALTENLKESLGAAVTFVLASGSGVIGAVALWESEGGFVSEDEIRLLEKLGTRLSFRIDGRRLEMKSKYESALLENIKQMRSLVESRSELKHLIRGFYAIFNQAVGSEFFVLLVPEKSPWDMRRFIAGIYGNILQNGVSATVREKDCLASVIRHKNSLKIDDISKLSPDEIDTLFISCGQKSLMAIPIVSNGRFIGAVMLGHPQAGKFTRLDLERSEMLTSAMTPALEEENLRGALFARDRYLNALNSLEQAQEKATSVEMFLEAAAETLAENVRTTLTRISMVNVDRTRLTTKALQTIRPFPGIKSGEVALSRELIPWHRMVLNENRPLLINQQDGESRLDSAEAEALAFKEAQSAIIMPISVNGLVCGVITMAEMRNWNRSPLDATALTFTRAASSVISLGVKSLYLSRALLNNVYGVGYSASAGSATKDMFRELKTPLSSIQGSIDLLKLKGFDRPEDSQKILATMEKSASRLISLINER